MTLVPDDFPRFTQLLTNEQPGVGTNNRKRTGKGSGSCGNGSIPSHSERKRERPGQFGKCRAGEWASLDTYAISKDFLRTYGERPNVPSKPRSDVHVQKFTMFYG
jgi:hypothetical protein